MNDVKVEVIRQAIPSNGFELFISLTKINTGLATTNHPDDFVTATSGRLFQGGDGILHGIAFSQLGEVGQI